jgi:hypothetical protein
LRATHSAEILPKIAALHPEVSYTLIIWKLLRIASTASQASAIVLGPCQFRGNRADRFDLMIACATKNCAHDWHLSDE